MPDPVLNDDDKGGDEELKEILETVRALKQGKGSSEGINEKFLTDNYKLRARNRALEEQAKSSKLPEGGMALSAEDVVRWKAFLDLGSDPAAIRKDLESGKQAREAVNATEKSKLVHRAASAHGFLAPALERYVKADGIELVLKEEKDASGKAAEVAYVKGEGDKQIPLTEYATKNWNDSLSVLTVKDTRHGSPPPIPGGNGMPVPTNNLTPQENEKIALRQSGRYSGF